MSLNVYVSGLPLSWSESDLQLHFSPFGAISSCKLLLDSSSKRSRGVGFVHFMQHTDAVAAIEAMNEKQPEGEDKPLLVKFATPKAAPIAPAPSPGAVAAAPAAGSGGGKKSSKQPGASESSSPKVRKHHLKIPSSPSSTASSSSFTAPVAPFSPSSSSELNLYIAGFPSAYTRDDLLALLCPFGAIASLRILPPSQQTPSTSGGKANVHNRGVGFARFVKAEDAERCIEALNGWSMEGGRGLQVRYANRTKASAAPPTAPLGLHNPAMAAAMSMQQLGGIGATGDYGAQGMYPGAMPYDYTTFVMSTGSMYRADGVDMASSAFPYAQQPTFMLDPAPFVAPYYPSVSSPLASGASTPSSSLSFAVPPLSLSSPPSPPSPAEPTLFVCHLAPHVNESLLMSLFGPFGPVSRLRLIRDLQTGASKGYAFVSYPSLSHCVAAMTAMDDRNVEGRVMKVQFRSGRPPAGAAAAAGQMAGDAYGMQSSGWMGQAGTYMGLPITA